MRISGARTKALRTGLSFVLTFAMTVGSLPMDGVAYASITKGAQASQTETKVEVPADNAATTSATTPGNIAADTTTAPTVDVTADKPKTVKVRFDANGGEGHMDDFEVTLNGGDWSIADALFTRDGYRFVGWSIASDVVKDAVDDPETDIDESLTGVVLADKQEFVDLVSQKRDEDGNVVETHDFGKYVSDDVLTLYAQWEKIETLEVSEPVVDENEVVKTEENVDEAVGDDVVEDTSVVEDDAIDATLDEEKELDRELLSGAFGNKTDGGVADKVGVSNPLSRKLTAPLMAAAAPSLTVQASPTGSRTGTAYAVLDSSGVLTFFRSTKTYSAGTGQTVTDVMGNTYTGQVFTRIETNTGTSSSNSPWYSRRTSVTLARIANGQVIAPKSCAYWFYGCNAMTAFEGAEQLDTSAVISMYYMFCNCSKMTTPPAVGSWNTSKVTSMCGAFYGCSAMTTPPAVSSWNTSVVTNISSMFHGCSSMTTPPAVGNWNTGAVTSIGSVFYNCSSMMTPPAVGNWNTSKATSMSSMFSGCKAMTTPPAVGSWNTSKVTSMQSMFSNCSAMTEPPAVGSWSTSAVTNMNGMFYGCSSMTEPPAVGNWTTSNVTNMGNMFGKCSKMPSLDVSGWNFSKVTNSSYRLGLQDCSALKELRVPAGAKLAGLPEHSAQGEYLATWCNNERDITGSTASALMSTVNAGKGAGTWTWEPMPENGLAYGVLDSAGTLTLFRARRLYKAGTNQTVTDIMGNTYTGQVYTGVETTGTSSSSAPWYYQRSSVNLARVADGQVIAPKSCVGWFYQCSYMTAFEGAERLDTSNATNMSYMFFSCSKMTTPPAVSSWNTSAVTNMSYMFYDCAAMMESPAVGNWTTSNVTNMGYMFGKCSKMMSLDVSGWNFSKVTNSSYYLGLQDCSALKELRVPAGAKLAGLPEHSAQGEYLATWCNNERDITGSTASALMSTVNAGKGAGTWTWEPIPENGLAYGVLDSAGTLTLFRARYIYTAGINQTVTDIMGNTYTGQVYTGVENTSTYTNSIPWYYQRSSVKLARIADGQVIAPKSCAYWFYECSNMTAFEGAERLDTSAVANMGSMFNYCSKMTTPPAVSSWNTGAVTNMSYMFSDCSSMTTPPAVSSWNTGAVTNMYALFSNCSKMTTPPAVGNWNTSVVTNIGWMFSDCSSMTTPPAVSSWNTGAVTSMEGMFSNCSAITEPPAVSSWDISAVTNMNYMFRDCSSMTEPPAVGNWGTSKVTNMGYMFNNCLKMTESPAVSSWNTSAVTNMSYMFCGCSKMPSLDVSRWDFSKVTNSSNYLGLQDCSALKELTVSAGAKLAGLPEHEAQGDYGTTWGNKARGITGSTASNLMNTVNAGNGAGTWKWELDPRAGTAYAVLDSAGTLTFFRSTNTYTAGTGKTVTDIMGNTYIGQVFTGVQNTGTNYSSVPWYTQRTNVKLARIADGQVIAPKSCTYWFYGCSNMTAFEGAERLDTSAVTFMSYMFSGCSAMTVPPAVGNWNTSNVVWMAGMFSGCSAMTEPPAVDGWNTSKVTLMGSMFNGCSTMTKPPAVGNWDTSKVIAMGSMFNGCSTMTEPPVVDNWDTSAVTIMEDMFDGCSSIIEPPAVGNWNTNAVYDMSGMFSYCSKMTSLDVSGWDFSKVTKLSDYLGLYGCSALRELKVPAGAKIVSLPEHSAQGDYAKTWGNADRGITGSTAANLVTTVNAGNGAGTWIWDLAGYTVNFMVDGSPTAMPAERVKADEDYVVPSCEVTKLYHDFVEWSGSDGKTYHAGDVVTAGTFAAGETLTLTAVFAPHEYGPGEIEGNLQLTVPASINFVVEPDGTLTGPSNASIVNESAVNTRVSSIEVKELDGFNFVANAEASGKQNAVELRFGPLSDMLDAASFLSKSGVADAAWAMGTAAGQNTVQLETEGKVAHVGADITKTNKFGEIRWFVKAGE